MSEFVSRPPSHAPKPLKNFFRGGMMPAAPRDVAALIVIDIRSLNLSSSEGRELEASVREYIFSELGKRTDLKDRTAIDLSNSVFGVAIE